MLPLDTIRVDERDGTSEVKKESELVKALHKFRIAGVTGIMVDVWWGIVERKGPRQYDLNGYRWEKLLSLLRAMIVSCKMMIAVQLCKSAEEILAYNVEALITEISL